MRRLAALFFKKRQDAASTIGVDESFVFALLARYRRLQWLAIKCRATR
jgi:hypothetical protein